MPPWEKYRKATAAADGPWAKYADQSGMKDAVAEPAQEDGFVDSVLSWLAKEGPAVGGGILGGIAGAPGGPAGVIAGSMAGGAAARGIQRATQAAMSPETSTDPLEVVSDVSGASLAQGVGAGIGEVGVAAAKAVAPSAIKIGSQLIRVMTGTPEKQAAAALRKPSILSEAVTSAESSTAYEVFEKYTGLKGLRELIKGSGKATLPAAKLEKMVVGTANMVEAGAKVDPQQLYQASQAAAHLRLAAKYGEPGAARAIESGIITNSKAVVDEALEKVYPEYGALRLGNFEAKVREAFSHWLPQNKNLSPNVLRPFSVGLGAMKAIESGNPLPLLLAPAISPKIAGLVIRIAAGTAPAAKAGADVAIRDALQTAVDNAEWYETRQDNE